MASWPEEGTLDKRGDPLHIRFPHRQEHLIREYARKKGLRLNDAIIHLLAMGLSISDWQEKYRIEDFTENFFERE
jgi:hypothetical protein